MTDNSCMFIFKEKGSDEIVIKAMGRAINKTVMIVELIKVLLLIGDLYVDVIYAFYLASASKSFRYDTKSVLLSCHNLILFAEY